MSIVQWRVNKSVPGHLFNIPSVNTKVLQYFLYCVYLLMVTLLQQFPYPPHTRNPFLEDIEQFLPLLLVLSLIWSAGIFVWVSLFMCKSLVYLLPIVGK